MLTLVVGVLVVGASVGFASLFVNRRYRRAIDAAAALLDSPRPGPDGLSVSGQRNGVPVDIAIGLKGGGDRCIITVPLQRGLLVSWRLRASSDHHYESCGAPACVTERLLDDAERVRLLDPAIVEIEMEDAQLTLESNAEAEQPETIREHIALACLLRSRVLLAFATVAAEAPPELRQRLNQEVHAFRRAR